MTPEAQILFIESLPAILTAIGALIVIALGALTALLVTVRKNAATAVEKLDNIHKVTNQHLTDVTTKWEDATEELKNSKIENAAVITGLQETIVGFQETIKTLIESNAVAQPVRAEAVRKTKELLAKVEESDGLLSNGNLAEFMKQFSTLSQEMKATQEVVKTLLAERDKKP